MSSKNKKTKETHTQCLLVSYDHDGTEPCAMQIRQIRPNENGGRAYWEYVAWIPTKFAERGRSLLIDDVPGKWYVREVWGTRSSEWVNEKSHDHTRQRRASDV